MDMRALKFRHEVIDADPPGGEHDITLIADINGNGSNDIVIGGKIGPPNLFWYENPTWTRHDMADAPQLEAGGVVVDITGNGRLDIVAGQQGRLNELYWFENPADPTGPWTKRIIENRFQKYHDQAVGDVNGDGKAELVVLSQGSGMLVYYDIPADPTVEPWPQECCHVVAEGVGNLEGLRIVDIDGDGKAEIIAGPFIYRLGEGGKWQCEPVAPDFVKSRVAVADFDGNGRLDIVLCEGETNPARLAICSPPDWKPRILRDDLFHPHSLEIADFDGNGKPDIFVAEMGLGKNANPKMLIFRNLGDGEFEEILIQAGIPAHEAKVGDLTGDGRPDIVSKPYDPERHIDVWYNES